MRSKDRIQPFIDFIFSKDYLDKLITKIWKLPKQNPIDITIILSSKGIITNFWTENPDLRFSQVLVNLGLLENYEGFWYYMEEDQILKEWNTY
jgi:hypothetical protein